MTADGRADRIYLYRTVQARESGFDQFGDRFRVFHASGIGDIALAAICKTVLTVLLHPIDDRADDRFLCADLFTRNELTQVIHVEQRADMQKLSKESGRLADAASLDVKSEVS